MRQGGRRIENEAGWYDRGCREEEKRQGSGSMVWRWKSFAVKEEAGNWIKGLEVEEVYCKRRGREVDQGSGGGRGLEEEAGRWIKGLDGEEV
jgi:hypothetical protein